MRERKSGMQERVHPAQETQQRGAVPHSSRLAQSKSDKGLGERTVGKGEINKINGVISIYLTVSYSKGKDSSKKRQENSI